MLYEKEQTPPTTCFPLHSKFQQAASLGLLLLLELHCPQRTSAFLQWKHILVQEPFPSNGRLSVAPLAYPLQFRIPLQFHAAPPPYIMLCFSKTKGWTVGYGPQIAFICCEIFLKEVSLPARFVLFLQPIRTRAYVCSKLYHVVITWYVPTSSGWVRNAMLPSVSPFPHFPFLVSHFLVPSFWSDPLHRVQYIVSSPHVRELPGNRFEYNLHLIKIPMPICNYSHALLYHTANNSVVCSAKFYRFLPAAKDY